MTNPDSEVRHDRVCVLFNEAVNWIAFSNFGGRVIGPQPIYSLFDLECPEPESTTSSLLALAKDFLLSHIARGKIKLYASYWTQKRDKEEECTALRIAVPPEFITKSYIDYKEWDGLPALYKCSDQSTDVYESYSHLVVDYKDLTNFFWGKDEETAGKMTASEGAMSEAVLRVKTRQGGSRRGRPTKHKWAEFTAATVERCLRGPIPVQEDLVRQMLEWCIEYWGGEPAVSDVRDYVAPTFRKFEAYWRKTRTSELAEKSQPAAGT